MLHGPKETQERAKRLRRTMTLPEVILWRELRGQRLGVRFRRQHPAGHFVLDFFCPARRLAIEVDGEVHSRGMQPSRDGARDAWLAIQGVRVVRIAARDVLADLDAVLRMIRHEVDASDYPSTAFGGPPPPPGEEREHA